MRNRRKGRVAILSAWDAVAGRGSMNQEKDEMTEDSASQADAGTEMVFKSSPAKMAFLCVLIALSCALISPGHL